MSPRKTENSGKRGRPKGCARSPKSGRKKGTQNKVTKEAREAAAQIVDDPEYRISLKARAIKGELSAAVEAMLWHYAKGKPKETIEATIKSEIRDLRDLSEAELYAMKNADHT